MRLAATGGLALGFALLALARFGPTPRWWTLLPTLGALAAVAVTDLASRRIPDAITLPGTAYGVVLAALLPEGRSLSEAGLGIAVGGGTVLLLAVISRGQIGGGDIKLMAMLGGFLGWRDALLVFAVSQILGGAIALVLLVSGRRGSRSGFPVGSVIAILGALFVIGQP